MNAQTALELKLHPTAADYADGLARSRGPYIVTQPVGQGDRQALISSGEQVPPAYRP